MPFDIKDETGKVVATFDNQPSQQDLEDLDSHLSGKSPVASTESKWSDLPKNIIPSAGKFLGGIGKAIAHPVDTAKGVLGVAAGGLGKLIPNELEINPEVAAKNEKSFDTLTDAYKDKYGGLQNIKKTLISDPVGSAADLSALLGVSGSALKAGGLTEAGNIASKAASLTDPLSAILMPAKAGIKAIANTSLPEKLYGSAIKLPLTKKWTQTLPGSEISDRQAAIAKGLENNVLSTELGKSKVTALEKEAKAGVDAVTNAGTQAGDTFKTADTLKGLDEPYIKAAASGNPAGAAKTIDEYASSVMSRPKTLNPDELNALKRQLYKETGDYTGNFKSFNDASQKGVAHQAMTMLEEKYPELKSLNANDSALIKLKEGIEKANARNINKDVLGLGTKVLTSGSQIPLAVWEATIGHPVVKESLAIALNKARKIEPLVNNLTPITNTAYQAGNINQYAHLSKLLGVK